MILFDKDEIQPRQCENTVRALTRGYYCFFFVTITYRASLESQNGCLYFDFDFDLDRPICSTSSTVFTEVTNTVCS